MQACTTKITIDGIDSDVEIHYIKSVYYPSEIYTGWPALYSQPLIKIEIERVRFVSDGSEVSARLLGEGYGQLEAACLDEHVRAGVVANN